MDTLIRYCVAESDAVRRRYHVDLCNLAALPASEHSRDVSARIDRALAELGVPDHLLGYGYLRTAIDIAVKDPETIHYVTGLLYPRVAKCHGVTPQMAEHSIRNAIQSGWSRCDDGVRKLYFGGKIRPGRTRPTNSEFIARLANVVRMQIVE